MKETEFDTGILERAWELPNRSGKMQHYLQLNDKVYSDFDGLPKKLKQFFNDAKTIKIEFKRNGEYLNIVSCSELHPPQEKIGGDKRPEEPKPAPAPSKDFPTADTLAIEDFVMAKLATRMNKCKDSAIGVYYPNGLPKDFEWPPALTASVNSLFIELMKQMSSYPLIKEAMKNAAKS